MTVSAALKPYLVSITAYDVELGGPGVHRGLPSTSLTLVLPADEPLDVGWGRSASSRAARWSTVSGLHTSPAQIHHCGHQRGVQLALTVAGARALLGVPASELAGQLVELGDLDRRLGLLPEQLAALPWPRWTERIEWALTEALRRDQAGSPSPAVGRALARLTRGARVQQVADELGYSRRHLDTLVRSETGLAPKELQRVARFEISTALLGRRTPLAQAAAASGYADQSHLTREWVALAGCPPTAWLREEFPFLQDLGHEQG